MEIEDSGTSEQGDHLPEIISREDLYALVWSEPMTRLASRFGLSDVGLAKACARMMVPVPGRGYWAKKKVGRAPRPTKLPTLPASAGTEKRQLRVRRREAPKAVDAAAEPIETILVNVPEVLTDPHPLVARSIRAFRGGKSGHDERLRPRTPECLDVVVTMGSIDRAMRILDGTVRAIESRGHVVEIQKYKREGYEHSQYRTVVLIDDEVVPFDITEIDTRVENARTGSADPYPKYRSVPSGRLAINIRTDHYKTPRWSDQGKRTLESQLGAFIHGLAVGALDLKEQRRAREERERLEIEAREREWQEAKRKRAEDARIRALHAAIDRMHTASYVNDYLNQVKANLVANPEAATEEMSAWVSWVEDHARRIDPFEPYPTVPKDPKPWG
jgi:hypothetical protein